MIFASAVLLPGIESLARAEEVARNIIVGVEAPIDIGGGKCARVRRARRW